MSKPREFEEALKEQEAIRCDYMMESKFAPGARWAYEWCRKNEADKLAEALEWIPNTDAIVSVRDALMGHHPKPDAIAKLDSYLEHLEQALKEYRGEK